MLVPPHITKCFTCRDKWRLDLINTNNCSVVPIYMSFYENNVTHYIWKKWKKNKKNTNLMKEIVSKTNIIMTKKYSATWWISSLYMMFYHEHTNDYYDNLNRKQAFLENDAVFLWQVILIKAKCIYFAD